MFHRSGSFGKLDEGRVVVFGSDLSYFSALLIVNTPQLFLSTNYFSLNALITRPQVEHEWNSFASKSQPLRVSCPTGEQISPYRLQLPYKNSVPLLVVSTFMHWVLSNALFLTIVEGGEMRGLAIFICIV